MLMSGVVLLADISARRAKGCLGFFALLRACLCALGAPEHAFAGYSPAWLRRWTRATGVPALDWQQAVDARLMVTAEAVVRLIKDTFCHDHPDRLGLERLLSGIRLLQTQEKPWKTDRTRRRRHGWVRLRRCTASGPTRGRPPARPLPATRPC